MTTTTTDNSLIITDSTPSVPVRPAIDRRDLLVDNGLVRSRWARTARVAWSTRRSQALRGQQVRTQDTAGLSDDAIRQVAPSVFATAPCESTTSDRYAFLPTSEVLGALRSEGWVVSEVTQSRASEERQGFQQHQLRLRHPLLKPARNGEIWTEAVLRNSHDGTTAKELNIGLWVLACSNGLTVSAATFASLRFAHRGQTLVGDVLDQAKDLIVRAPVVHGVVDQWQQRVLSPAEQLEFAVQAWQLRWDNDSTAPVRPESLLYRRRWDDRKPTLWSTFNAVQENLIQGGLGDGSRSATGRRQSARALSGVNAQRQVNVGLWDLAHGFAAGTVQPDPTILALAV